MIVYRISKEKHIRDLAGTGGLYSSGRWHNQGTCILYTAGTQSLAMVETLANSPVPPTGMALLVLEIPDEVEIKAIDVASLPGNWNTHPAPKELAEIGDRWARENQSLAMKVPSAHSDTEFNYLINPSHPDRSKLRVIEVKPKFFDSRLKGTP